MRDIKFRVWDEKRKKWVTDFVICSDGFVKSLSSPSFYYDGLHETKTTISQFTGLTDKNGKNIYEGDIVLQHEKKEVVEWVMRGCWFPFIYVKGGVNDHLDQAYSEHMEVIGNIYENQELLVGQI